MIENKLGHKIEATTRDELVDLGEICNLLKDKIGKVDDYCEKSKFEQASEEDAQEINDSQKKLFAKS